MTTPRPILDAPLDCGEATVLPEWVDYNGHMNVGYYNLAFDQALDRAFDRFDCGKAYVERTNHSFFVLETHVRYLREVTLGDPLAFNFQLIARDAKRLHYFCEMRHGRDGFLSATSEQMALHVDLGQRRAAPMPPHLDRLFADLATAHAPLPRPDGLGRVMSLGPRAA
ncbi:thioesterase family protein [Zavarzinia compransoris]|uniref:thioesterase family protein n=1 Tax=Zavarzinia marina TaxID=2911065 RepID=UPI001F3628F0|nr:thioesterase family protein [Zavarzinia marina]MCF4164306.1 thioesterase family protein [Zavarzinia marina]